MTDALKTIPKAIFGRFLHAWRERDWVVALVWLGAYMVVGGATAAFSLALAFSYFRELLYILGQIVLVYPWLRAAVVFFGGAMILAYLSLFLRWVARDPQRETGLHPPTRPLFSRRFVGIAQRWTLRRAVVGCIMLPVITATTTGLIAYRPPRFEDDPNLIRIYVARFWDRNGLWGVSAEGEDAQEAVAAAIREQSSMRPTLRDRVIVKSLRCVIAPHGDKGGMRRAAHLALQGNADVIVYGKVLPHRTAKPEKYYIRVVPATRDPRTGVFTGPRGFVITQDPSPPELSHQALALGCLVLGYANYVRHDDTSALTFFEMLLNAREWWIGSKQPDEDRMGVVLFAAGSYLRRALRGGHSPHRDLEQAASYYKTALRVDPKLAVAHNNLGNALRAQGDLVGATREFREAVRIDPRDPVARLNLGTSLADCGEWSAAITEYQEVLRTEPEWAVPHYNLGTVLSDQGDSEGAIREYREAVRIEPDFSEAHNNLGTALASLGDWPAAIEEYRTALRIEPDDAIAHHNLGTALATQGDSSKAIREYRHALQIRPDLAIAHNDLGALLARRGDWSGAVGHFRQALRIDPNLVAARCNLAEALDGQGDLAGAEREREAALNIDLGLSTQILVGNGTPTRDHLARAVVGCRRALLVDPDNVAARNALGLMLARQGDLAAAVQEFQEASRIDPHDAATHSNLGLVLSLQGDVAEAEKALREAIRLDSTIALAHHNLGSVLQDQGDLEGAIRQYREALRLDPNLAATHTLLGSALRAQSDLAGAIKEHREAVRIDPDLVGARYNLAVALRAQGDHSGAVRELRKALRIDPDFAPAYLHLGFWLKDSDPAQAATHFRRFLDLRPSLVHDDYIRAFIEKHGQ